MQVAGFFVQTIPDWIGWLKYVSFIYYGYNTLLKVLLLSFRPRFDLQLLSFWCLLVTASLVLAATSKKGIKYAILTFWDDKYVLSMSCLACLVIPKSIHACIQMLDTWSRLAQSRNAARLCYVPTTM